MSYADVLNLRFQYLYRYSFQNQLMWIHSYFDENNNFGH